MRRATWVPERGDVVWLDFDPQAGHEQKGRRPAVVISPSSYNGKAGLFLACPVTNQRKGYPFETSVPDALPVQGFVLCDQLRSLDWRARHAELICRLPVEVIEDIAAKVIVLVEVGG